MRPLVTEYGVLLICLVVVNAEDAARESTQRNQAACLGRKISRPCMAQGHVRLESVQIHSADTRRHAIQLGVVPGDRKCNRRVEQDAEVIRIVCVLPKVVGIDDQPTPDSLL